MDESGLGFDGLFEAFEVDHDLLAAEVEHGAEKEIRPAQGKDCGAGEIGALWNCADLEAPLRSAEEAGVAGAAGELDDAASGSGIALLDAVGHAALVGEIEAAVGDGVKLGTDAEWLRSGLFNGGNAAVPPGDVGGVAEEGPDLSRGAMDADAGAKLHRSRLTERRENDRWRGDPGLSKHGQLQQDPIFAAARNRILYSFSLKILENISLGQFTTFGIGGPARWFVEATGEDEVREAVAWAQEHRAPLFVLGGGSNLLVADAGFDGLVLRVALRGIEATEGGNERCVYRAAAGEPWDDFVARSVEDNCAGIECLAGIPGTVGGTPVQNVGAYGQEVSSTIERVRAFDLHEHSFVEFSGAECGFAYRLSRFNSIDRGRFIVTRVDYRLTPGGTPTLGYADVRRAMDAAGITSPTVAQVALAVRQIRHSKGMLIVGGDEDSRSAGSFFKNPVVSEEVFQTIAAGSAGAPPRFPAGLGTEDGGRVKIPAAWLIEQAGFHKGYRLGAAGISSRHTLALVNRGNATAKDVLALAARIADAVEERFGVRLEREPVLLGFES